MSEKIIEAACRALVNYWGHDPDRLVWPGNPMWVGARRFAALPSKAEPMPLWMYFTSEIHVIMEAIAHADDQP